MDVAFSILAAMPAVLVLSWLIQQRRVIPRTWKAMILITLALCQCVLLWLRHESKEVTQQARIRKLYQGRGLSPK